MAWPEISEPDQRPHETDYQYIERLVKRIAELESRLQRSEVERLLQEWKRSRDEMEDDMCGLADVLLLDALELFIKHLERAIETDRQAWKG